MSWSWCPMGERNIWFLPYRARCCLYNIMEDSGASLAYGAEGGAPSVGWWGVWHSPPAWGMRGVGSVAESKPVINISYHHSIISPHDQHGHHLTRSDGHLLINPVHPLLTYSLPPGKHSTKSYIHPIQVLLASETLEKKHRFKITLQKYQAIPKSNTGSVRQ